MVLQINVSTCDMSNKKYQNNVAHRDDRPFAQYTERSSSIEKERLKHENKSPCWNKN